MEDIITLGEPMVVWIPQQTGNFSEVETFQKGVAGAELNVAVGVSRLGHKICYISRLGKDVFGAYILEKLKAEKIDTSAIIMDAEHLTGSYFKTKVTEGNPEVFYLRKNSGASFLAEEDLQEKFFKEGKILHLTGIAAAISENCLNACKRAKALAKKHGMKVSFDPNIRPSLWKSKEEMQRVLNKLAADCDYVLPGIEEGKILTGEDTWEEIADFYLKMGVKNVIIKDGSSGAVYKCADGRSGVVKGFHVAQIVDTVGAGDAFAAGVLTGILENLPLSEAVRRGNAMGAMMVTEPGDNEAMPQRDTLEKFMKS